MILFYKPGLRFIWCHALVHVLPRSAQNSDGMHLLSCAYQRGPIMVSWRGRFSYHTFTLASGTAGSWPDFFLKVCIPTHWIFDFSGFSAVSITDNILRALLCSGWYFRLFRVMTFFEGVWSVQVNLRALSVRLGIEVPSWSYWKSLSYLQVDVYISTLSVRGILVVSSCSCGSLLIKGLQSFWRDFFISARNVPGGCFPTSLYRCPLTKKVTWGDVPFYPMGLFYQFFLVL